MEPVIPANECNRSEVETQRNRTAHFWKYCGCALLTHDDHCCGKHASGIWTYNFDAALWLSAGESQQPHACKLENFQDCFVELPQEH